MPSGKFTKRNYCQAAIFTVIISFSSVKNHHQYYAAWLLNYVKIKRQGCE